MEFQISNESLTTLRGITITANFPELYAWLDTELEPYLSMAVTEETIPVAKNYRASLRKLKDGIEQYRKEAKQAALSSYNKFEADCKVATGKIDAAVENIDRQVKEYEDTEKAAKMGELKAYYDSCENAEAKEYCPWERVVNPKWANKTYSAEDAKEEIRTALYNTEVNLESIRTMGEEDAAYLLTVYKDTHDINAVIRKRSELIQARGREEQRKRQEEERRKAMEEAKRAQEIKAAEEAVDEEGEPFEPEDDDPLTTVVFKVSCRKSQLAALGRYMKIQGIKYGRA